MSNNGGSQGSAYEAVKAYSKYGFKLVEPDKKSFELYYQGRRIAVLNQERTTAQVIMEGCQNYLVNVHKSALGL